MQIFLSDAQWIKEESKKFCIPELRVSIDVRDCLTCNESYTIQDPLWLFHREIHWLIYNVYFPFSDAIYLLSNKPTDKERKIVWEAAPITQAGIEKLTRDIENRENLYELFLDSHMKTSVGPFYDKDEFYEYFQEGFAFFQKYWSCVNTLMQEARQANDDEIFNKKYWAVNRLLDDMKSMWHPLWYGEVPELKKWEILPGERYFEYEWKRIIFRNNGNMTSGRIQELKDIMRIKYMRSHIEAERKRKEEVARAEAYHSEHWEWPDEFEIPF